ncbi:MAG: hypothetical protein HUJ16_02875, partial [Kangiella sp.]|nr:hypothetical protein [Kangiella sp.]
MARPARPFAIYKRKVKNSRRYVYYAKIRDPETGEYTRTVSTGQTARATAEEWTRNYLDKEQHREERERRERSRVTVATLAEGYWLPTGHYAESRRARGATVSNGHLDISEGY